MTKEEARKYLIDISYTLGNLSVEYLTEKHGKKMRDAISVLEQEPKTGHWIGDKYNYSCDKCGHGLLDIAHSIDYISFEKPNYCPNCGARMVKPQESEVNNG